MYSRVDEFRRWRNDCVFGPIAQADRSNDRSLKAHWFGHGVIWLENTADTNREAVSKTPIERQMGTALSTLKVYLIDR